MSGVREECGVFGVFSPHRTDAAMTAYYGLFALQHRGQEGCGIVVSDDGVFRFHKGFGLVSDVMTPAALASLGDGSMAVGHVRYSTTGGSSAANIQPLLVNHIKGHLAIAHNGNLVNFAQLREQLELTGAVFHTTSDTELISHLIIRERLTAPSIEIAAQRAMHLLRGAYSLVIMSPSKLIAVRDPNGFRPLCYGVCSDGTYIAASESCALDSVGAKFVRDLLPGEIVVFDKNGVRSLTAQCENSKNNLCVFEYIYFARPDSVIDGCSVQRARITAGAYLAQEHPVDADVVIGVPDSGLDAALGYSQQSGIPYCIGLIKNKYIGRTFIAPVQKTRESMVRIKLNPVPEAVAGKRVVLVDDSIVRGTTSKYIVKLLREAGAAEVHMRVSAPPFKNPCYYGTDIDSRENLIACQMNTREIAEMIGAESLGFLSVEHAKMLACSTCCTACFSGEYPTEIPTKPRKDKFEKRISDKEAN